MVINGYSVLAADAIGARTLVASGLEDLRRRAHWHKAMWEKSGEMPRLIFGGLMLLSGDASSSQIES